MPSPSVEIMWQEIRVLKGRVCDIENSFGLSSGTGLSLVGWQDTLNKSSILNKNNTITNTGNTLTFQDGAIAIVGTSTPLISSTYDYSGINYVDVRNTIYPDHYNGGFHYSAITKTFWVTFFDDATSKYFDMGLDPARGFVIGQDSATILFKVDKIGNIFAPHLINSSTGQYSTLNIDNATGQIVKGTIASGSNPDLQQVTDTGNTTTDSIYLSGSGLKFGAENTQSPSFGELHSLGILSLGNASGNGISVDATNATTSRGIKLPDADGTLVMQVNGILADGAGNINLPSIGTGTPTQLAFWNAATGLASTSNMYWDSTNQRLIYGAATASLMPSGVNSAMMLINNPIYAVNYGTSTGGIRFYRTQGTQVAPTAVTFGVNFGTFGGGGYDGTAFTGTTGAMQIISSETWTGAAHGTCVHFYATPNGSTALTTYMFRIYGRGELHLGLGLINNPDPGDGARLVVVDSTFPQASFRYDNSTNYANVQVGSTGLATFTAHGSGAGFKFAQPVTASQYKLSALNTAPASSTDVGTVGEIRVTADFIYVCTATNTWVRAALSTF